MQQAWRLTGVLSSPITLLSDAASPALVSLPWAVLSTQFFRGEQCLWAELHDTIDQLRQAVTGFVDRYNTSWLIQRHGHQTPKEAYQAAQVTAAA
jgi:putative transposase